MKINRKCKDMPSQVYEDIVSSHADTSPIHVDFVQNPTQDSAQISTQESTQNPTQNAVQNTQQNAVELQNVSVYAGKTRLVENVDLAVKPKQFFMIVGANGAGKTSLIRAICGTLPYKGSILHFGQDVRTLSPTEFAKKFGILSQKSEPTYPYTVKEVVELGRYAHTSGLIPRLTKLDREAIDCAIEQTQLEPLQNRTITTLSGGEYQRVLLAKLIAQDPQVFILDEPSTHLDFAHQLMLFDFLRRLQHSGKTVVAVVHDFNLIKEYGTHGILLKSGGTVAQGEILQILTENNLKTAFNTAIPDWFSLPKS